MTPQTIALAAITLSSTEAQKARRSRFDKKALEELAASIEAHGVLQPIIVRPAPAKAGAHHYELVAGERRVVAAGLAGLDEIQANVRELTDEQVVEIQLIENLQREDVHPMEEAEGYEQLRQCGHPVDELHARVGKSRSYVYGRLKLLALCKQARKAFFADEISASVALLIARIPDEKLQRQALEDILTGRWGDGAMSYREAKELIEDDYMLRLAEAPFPTDVELGGAGPCGTCPKRTGNQAELFADIKSADVCTDPVCFKAKSRAHWQSLIAAARKAGTPVITGNKAKQIAPHGAAPNRHIQGYVRADDHPWTIDGRSKKTAKSLVGPEHVVLLQDPESGAAVEVVSDARVRAAVEKDRPASSSTRSENAAAKKEKLKLERRVRVETYVRARASITKLPEQAVLARWIFSQLSADAKKLLCQIRGFEPPKTPIYSGGPKQPNHDAIRKQIDELKPGKGLGQWILDCIFAERIGYMRHGFGPNLEGVPTLEAFAKEHGVSIATVRRQLAPAKKKKTKKKPKKKAAQKKAGARSTTKKRKKTRARKK